MIGKKNLLVVLNQLNPHWKIMTVMNLYTVVNILNLPTTVSAADRHGFKMLDFKRLGGYNDLFYK